MGEKYNDNNNEKVNHTREREWVGGSGWGVVSLMGKKSQLQNSRNCLHYNQFKVIKSK